MFKFAPIVKNLVWGSESWVLSAVPGSESTVAEGPCQGSPLSEIFPGEFPLLIKFIDARKDLSVQVHPNDELAAERHHCKGKTEMWYVTGCEDGARLLSGLSRPLTPELYEKAVKEHRTVDYLASHEVHPGDVFFLPAGRIHAIGAGCRLAEIQQTSDITYRIYDYDRPGLDGKPRELHTSLAKDAIDYSVLPDYRTHYTAVPGKEVELVRCPYFTTSLLELPAGSRFSAAADSDFLILICTGGSAEVFGQSGEQCSLREGECCLLLREDFSIRTESGTNFLTVR